jgi:hypothetical protein
MKRFLTLSTVVALSGCATIEGLTDRAGIGRSGSAAAPAAAPAPARETSAPPPPANAQTAESLDTTTPEQRAAATAPPATPNRSLGTTVVSLGSAAEPGLWLKTPLVKAEQPGRVTNPATGKSSAVTLIPIDGPSTAGSRMSLGAMRLIGASLTDLTEVEVALEG